MFHPLEAQRGAGSRRRRIIPCLRLTALALCALAAVPFAAAQDSEALRKEIAELKQAQQAMQKDLQEIKDLLKNGARAGGGPTMLPSILDAKGILVKGDANAPVTIVEFTDMQCPFCSRHAINTLAQIDKDYIKTGRVRYVVKDYPLESLHNNAFLAAQANFCASEQDHAWEMHDRLLSNQQKLGSDDLNGYAEAMGMDVANFKACLASGRYAPVVRKEISEAQSAGVSGTPTFFLGSADARSFQMKPVKMLTGALSYAAFQSAIDELLNKK